MIFFFTIYRLGKIIPKEEVGYRMIRVLRTAHQIVHKNGNIGMIQKKPGHQTRPFLWRAQVNKYYEMSKQRDQHLNSSKGN